MKARCAIVSGCRGRTATEFQFHEIWDDSNLFADFCGLAPCQPESAQFEASWINGSGSQKYLSPIQLKETVIHFQNIFWSHHVEESQISKGL